MRGLAGVGLVLTALTASACRENGSDPDVTSSVPAPEWHLQEMWRVGGADAEGPEAFGTPHFLAEDAWGRVYVLERRAQQVIVFDSTGAWIRTIGRPGQGPGELGRAFGLAVDDAGRLWVIDPRNLRYTVFDSTGRFHSTIRRELPPFGARWYGRIAHDVLWDQATLENRPGAPEAYLRWDSTVSPPYRDTLMLPDTAQPAFRTEQTQGSTRNVFSFPIPFTPAPLHAIAPDGTVWFAVSDRYEIVRRNRAGDTLATIRRPWTPDPVTAAERDEWVTGFDRLGGQRPDASLFPETKPALERFAVDDDGNLWVLPRGADGTFDVFAPDGRYLAVVRTSIMTWGVGQPVLISRDHITWVTTDSLDASVVVRARIVGRSRPIP